MKSPIYKFNRLLADTIKLLFATLTLSYSVAVMAETADQNSAETYVDSVTQWGAWELDIEPAAGGLNKPATQALKARPSRFTLRTNSISALAPQQPQSPQITTQGPPTTPPFGGPSDGFF